MTAPSTAFSPSLRDLWRRTRGPLAFVLAAVGIAALVAVSSPTWPVGHLDPEAVTGQGSRALAQILRKRGADVTVARSVDAAAAAAGPDTVLLVVRSHELRPDDVARLTDLPGDQLLVQPTPDLLEAAAPGVEVAASSLPAEPLEPDCSLQAAVMAGSAELGETLYTGGSLACYPGEEGHSLVQMEEAGRTITVLGSQQPLRNDSLALEGNAALLLNLLAGRDVVWLIPAPAAAQPTELHELIHPGFVLSLPVLVAAFALLAFWRGRRLGPLVAERLPVVVRASETTEGRARLYTSRRARDRAAAALRSGVVDRLRPVLGLGPDAAPDTVAAAVSARCASSPQQVHALLYGEPDGADPFLRSDADLVRLADELDRLEREVRQS